VKVGDFIFVYGSLRKGGGKHYILQNGTRYICNDTLPDAVLYNIPNGSFPFPGLKLVTKGSEVIGDVLEITDEFLPATLDRFEGYPELYSRQKVETNSGHVAWVYVFNHEVDEKNLITSGDWLDR
jgi:gamma-glutamylcyclotransferase (GGCT)/AIG2-like uncharacterized protein YtfP